MIQSPSRSIELNRQGDAGRNAGSYAKEQTQANAIADTKDNGVCDSPGQQPQRTVLPTQQVVSEIEAANHIKESARNANGCEYVVVHSKIIAARF